MADQSLTDDYAAASENTAERVKMIAMCDHAGIPITKMDKLLGYNYGTCSRLKNRHPELYQREIELLCARSFDIFKRGQIQQIQRMMVNVPRMEAILVAAAEGKPWPDDAGNETKPPTKDQVVATKAFLDHYQRLCSIVDTIEVAPPLPEETEEEKQFEAAAENAHLDDHLDKTLGTN